MPLAARLPKLCTAARSPNAEPRNVLGGMGRDGGVFSGFHAADAEAGKHEPHGEQHPVRGVERESDVRERERGDACDEDGPSADTVDESPGRDADDGRRGVVGGVQPERDRRRPDVAVFGLKQFGGAQDQQGGCDIAGFEGANPDEQLAERSLKDWADLDLDRSAFARGRGRGVADGVEDRPRWISRSSVPPGVGRRSISTRVEPAGHRYRPDPSRT